MKVKIKVIRKDFYEDLAQEYLTEGKEAGACPLLEVGDEFLYEGGAVMPEGFCPWAWIDIYRAVSSLSLGATYKPWYNRDKIKFGCCTDGVRPVVFLLEAVED